MSTATDQNAEFEAWLQEVVVPILREEDAGRVTYYTADEALQFLAESRRAAAKTSDISISPISGFPAISIGMPITSEMVADLIDEDS